MGWARGRGRPTGKNKPDIAQRTPCLTNPDIQSKKARNNWMVHKVC